MKQSILAILFLLVATSASATQNNKEFRLNKIDEFTGERIWLSNSVPVASSADQDLSMEVAFASISNKGIGQDPTQFISITLSTVNRSLFVSKGNSLFLKLKDGNVIRLKASDNFYTRTVPINKIKTHAHVEATYEVSATNLEKIKEIGISAIKMYTSKSVFEISLPKSGKQKVSELLAYVLNQ